MANPIRLLVVDDEEQFVLHRGRHWYVILNLFPYNNGHLLIAPFRHVDSFSGLTSEERCDLMETISLAESMIGRAMSPQGMNVGANLGHCAGAGVPGHVHVHIVPRWEGDTNFMPVVGDTRVLPESLSDTYDRLLASLAEE